MTFLTTPERASTLGTCSCSNNSGNISYTCTSNRTCKSNKTCNGNCTGFRVCVTPTGAKVSINGVGAAS